MFVYSIFAHYYCRFTVQRERSVDKGVLGKTWYMVAAKQYV